MDVRMFIYIKYVWAKENLNRLPFQDLKILTMQVANINSRKDIIKLILLKYTQVIAGYLTY